MKKSIHDPVPRIKRSKKNVSWKKISKRSCGAGGDYSRSVISIRHNWQRRRNQKYRIAFMYFSKKLEKIYDNYVGVELLFSKGYLGLKLMKEISEDTYLISSGTKRKHKIVARSLRKIKPREYNEEDLEFDMKNKVIIIPIEQIEEFKDTDFDYGFQDIEETYKKQNDLGT